MTPLFGQGMFQTPANATPEMLERKRAIMAALMPRFGSAKYVGEGLGQLATGVAMGRQGRKLDQAEAAGKEQAGSLFQRILSGASGGGDGFSVLGAPQGPNQQIANDAMAAIGKPSSISQSLARTESGGNYGATNSEGYTGKYQWGQARLDDFNRANGSNFTLDQFKQTPQLQEQAQAWHEQDILSELGGYVGRDVNGIQMTPGAIVAMAHLGGKGGARKFIESGGAYDPADSNGTNLSDYARTHNGAGQTQQVSQGGEIPLENLYAALANQWLDPSQRSVITSMIEQRQQAADPARALELQGAQIGLQKSQLELEQMRNPQPKPQYTTMTPDEVATLGLPPGVYERAPDGNIERVAETQAPVDPIADLRARAKAAGLEEGSPEFQQFMMAGGKTEGGMVVESDGQGGFRMVQGAGAGAAAAKPFTEAQSKDVTFSTRARGALEALEPIAGSLTSRSDIAAGWLPMGLGGGMQNSDYQVARTAADEFLQAILRKDTGAAITPGEQELYGGTYLPQPGDGPERLAYKQQARLRAVKALEAGMSPAQIVAQERALDGGATPEAPKAQKPVSEMSDAELLEMLK